MAQLNDIAADLPAVQATRSVPEVAFGSAAKGRSMLERLIA